VLLALAAVALVAGGALLFAQHSRTGTTSLGLQVSPAVQLTNLTSTTVDLWIRLGTGSGYLWGDSSSTCTTPIGTATTYTTSGKYLGIPLTSIPFTTSNNYVCAYDPGASVSSAYVVWPHTAASLAFVQQPAQTAAGASISPAVTVKVLDTNGILYTGSNASVTIAIGTNPSGGTLSGTLTQSAVNGVATFSNLSINKDGTGYTLTATSGTLSSATSNAFNITSNTATKLVFTTQPGGGTGGTAWTTQPVVTLEDADGNTVTGTAQNVTLAIQNNAGPGGVLSGTTTVAVNTSTGVATFSGLSINKAGTGYTLTATGSTVDTTAGTVVSSPFNITTGTATQLAFTTSPSNSTGGVAFGTQPVVTLEDAGGNTVTGTAQNVTLAIQNNAGPGGVLSGTTMVAVSTSTGQAIFSGLSINKAGTGYTLTATGNAVSTTAGVVVSSAFNITTGTATQLAFTASPSNSTGGVAFGTQPVVTLEDAGGNTVTGTAQNVTLAIQNNPSSGTLSGTTMVAVSTSTGQATFNGLSINKAGTGYTLTATGNTVSTTAGVVVSNAFNITTGTATQLAFTTSPSNSTGGAAFGTQPVVTLEDAGGNTVTGTAQNVTLAIQNNPGSGTLSGTTMVAVSTSTGQAIFSGLSINKAGTGYTLTATGNTVSTTAGVVVSSAFNITTGTAAQLAFTTQPGGGTAGAAWTAQPVVTLEDAGGNTVTGTTQNVTLAIQSNPSSGTLSGTTMVAVNTGTGQATFSGLSINKAGTGYTLTATGSTVDTSAGAVVSSAFNITTGAAAQLAFTTQPGGGAAGAAWTPQPVVTLEDVDGNTVTGTAQNVTLAIQNNAGPGGVLSGTTMVAVNTSTGQATFSGLSINKAGTGYTLTATGSTVDTSAGVVVSSAFNITAGAVSASLSTVSANPTSVIADNSTTSTITVTLLDANSNPVSGKTVTLAQGSGTSTISAASGPSSATGVVTFTVKASTAQSVTYTATDSTDGVTISQTAAVTFTTDKLVFTTEPGGGTGGTAWSTQPKVTVETSSGSTVTTGTNSTASITLAITSGTPTSGGPGTLTCTADPKSASGGVDTFAGCEINTAGTGYTLMATSSGLATATSSAFNITTGGVSASVSTVIASPTSVPADGATTSTITVTLTDAGGNPVSGKTVTLAGSSGTHSTITTVSGTTNASGQATFTVKDSTAESVTYTATDTTDSNLVISQQATVTFTASQLVFTSSAVSVTAGACSSEITVRTEDGAGNHTDPPSTVTVALSSNSTGTYGFYSDSGCSTSITSVTIGTSTSRANFYYEDTKAGSPVITAAATGGVTSSPTQTETVNPAAVSASASTVTASPTSVPADGATTSTITVTLMDAYSNPVSGKTVTLARSSGGTHSTITTVSGTTNASGQATFTVKDSTAESVTYTATDTTDSITVTQTATVTFTPGTATKVVFTTQPGGGTGGTAWGTQPVVTVEDANGNTVTGSSASITLAIGTNPSGGTLACTTNPQNASSGVDTFAGCEINKAGTGYTLTATSTGLTSATSNSFSITVGTAAQLAFTTQPGGGTAATAWTAQPVVTVQDAGGNTVTSSSASITLAITSGTGTTGAALSCTADPKSASSGIDTFAGCAINFAGTGYTLTATSSGLTSATSSAFNITVGSAAKLAFTTQPGGGTAATAWSQQPVVTVEDAGGNTVTSSSASITLAIGTGSGTLTCTGGLSTSASSGVATFAGCEINKSGTGDTLMATSSGLTTATSSAFNIAAGTATQLVFTTQPGGGTGGTAWTAQPVVTVEDANNNTVTSSSASIQLAIGTGSGTLTCNANPLGASSGVATFAGCKINLVGTGYTLTATSSGLTSATSSAFNITVGTAAQLAFTTQPGGGTAATAWTVQPAVTVEDAGGNTVTSSSASIQLAIGTGSGTLTCNTNPLGASSGVATFAGCKINTVGTGDTLTATSSGLTTATSSSFNITVGTPTAGNSTVTASPTSVPADGTTTSTITVTLNDAGGNPVSGKTVTLARTSGGTHSTITTVSGTTNSSGQATFTVKDSTAESVTYTGTDTTDSVTVTQTAAVTFTASKLVFATSAVSVAAGSCSSVITVETEDASGDVTDPGSAVTVNLSSSSTGTATFYSGSGCTGQITSVSIATTASSANFYYKDTKAGNPVITASATVDGDNSAPTQTETVTVGAASQLVWGVQPPSSVSFSTTISPAMTVLIEDANGNLVTTSSASVSLSLQNAPLFSGIGGTDTVNAVSGVATFGNVDVTGTFNGSANFQATSSGLQSANSNTFSLTGGF
jgi:5-hydroxyisourate hydrolase-like protein (transthyretin family)